MTNIRSKMNQILASTVVTLGVFGMGTVLGWSSPALPAMNSEKNGFFGNLSLESQSWIGSSATLGAFAACPFGGLGIDKLGRKRTLLVVTIPFTAAWILIGCSKTVWLMCVGRFLTGFCGGIFTLTAPVYIGEVAQSKIRGMLMNSFQVMLVTGILFSYLVGTALSWQMLSFTCAIIPGLFLFFSIIIPETPRYLLSRGDISGAQKSLAWFRGYDVSTNNSVTLPPEISDEFESLQSIIEESRKQTANFGDLLKPNVLKPLAISLSLMVLEQLSAFNVVIFYCVDIFTAAGVSIDSYWASNIVAVIQVVVTILATPLVDMAGRRILLLISEAFMGLSFIALGTFFYIKGNGGGQGLGWLPMLSVIVFIVAFAIGIGPLSWTVMGEILHPDVKGLCSAIAVSLVWFSAFIVTKIYSSLVESVGIAWAFWIFSLVSIGGTFIVYFCVPETNGKSLDEIQQLFVKGRNNTGSNVGRNGMDNKP